MRSGLLLLLLLLCSPPARALGPDVYESERFRLSLRRPSPQWTWRVPARDAAEGDSKIGSINGTTGFQLLAKLTREQQPEDPAFVNVTLDCIPKTPGHEDAAESARRFVEAMRPNDGNYAVLEAPKEIAVDGRPGAFTELEVTLKRAEADGSRTSYPAHVRAWFFAADEHWLRLIVSAKREQWPAVEADLRKLSDSLKFLPAPPAPAPVPASPKGAGDEVLDGLRF